jgi:Tol biopolymer transport system component
VQQLALPSWAVKPFLWVALLLPLLQACQNNPPPASTRSEPNVETLAVASVTAQASDQIQTDTAPLKTIPITPSFSPEPARTTPIPEVVQNGSAFSPTQVTPIASEAHIAYIQNQDIFLWDGSGSKHEITQGEQVQQLHISPDGQMIAYTRSVDEFREELWVIGTDGSGERRLVSADEFNVMGPRALAVVPDTFAWIPGTHLVAFNTRQIVEGPGSASYDDLRTVNADNGQMQTLLAPGKGGQFFSSPDGTQIAVSSPKSIGLIGVNGTNLRPDILDYSPVTTYSEYHYYAQPAWENDSTGLLVAIPPPDPLAVPLKPTTLWQAPVDGSKARQLGNISTGSFFGMEVFYSPDRSHILYLNSSGNPDQNLRSLHIARPDGSQDSIYITATELTISGWAPDSQHFTFSVGNQGNLQLGQIGGKFQPLLGVSSNPLNLQWIDDENFIYVRSGADSYEIHLHSLPGEDVLLGTDPAFLSIYDFAR